MERSRSRVDAGSNTAAGGGGVAGNYSDSYDYLFKFLVIGSAGTGKSCLLHHFIEGRFKEDSSHTIGVEFGSKIVPVGGKTVKLQVYIIISSWIDSSGSRIVQLKLNKNVSDGIFRSGTQLDRSDFGQ